MNASRLLVVVAALLCACFLVVTGCEHEEGITTASDLHATTVAAELEATLQAAATLQAFFDAWEAKDVGAYKALLSEHRRQEMNVGDWTFSSGSVEFGPMAAAPEVTEGRMATYGYAYRPGIAQEDVRCFRASITTYLNPGVIGAVESGEVLPWMWWVVRDADGEWGVDGWGA
ncbi:MAG: hypothetical protein JXA87_06075 [Thermoleophilia bacterium]|nr:hypothetical protein [Thermoleophilia bacterium]